MPIQPPSRAELARIAEEYRLGLSEGELATFAELAGPTLAGFARIDELLEGDSPVLDASGHRLRTRASTDRCRAVTCMPPPSSSQGRQAADGFADERAMTFTD